MRIPSRPWRARAAPTLALLIASLLAGCQRSQPVAAPARMSVLLVTLDTTRADYLGVYGQPRIRTPHLDALGGQGVVFTKAFSSAPLTLPAHASLLTGATPLVHGVRDNFGASLPAGVPTLAETLAAGGWATGAVVGAAVLDAGSGLERGFQSYDDLRPAASGAAAPVERDGGEVIDHALALLERLRAGPFLLWVHLYDAHLPYQPPAPYSELYASDAYGGEVAYLDALVGRLTERLRVAGVRDVLVVVAGDHGEGLGEHGEPDHGVFLYDSTLHVPLLLWAPGTLRRARIDRVVRDIDVMPTLLDLLGLEVPPGVAGRSLRPLLEGRADPDRLAYAESDYARLHYGWSPLRALRDAAFKYVEAPQPELYDVRADPGETRNLVAEQARVAAALRERLDQMQAAAAASPGAGAPAAAPDALERLRSLGYAGATLRSKPGERLADPKTRRAALPALSRASAESIGLIEGGRAAAALTLLDAAVAAEPRFLDGHVLRGEALYRLERFEDAAAAFQRALDLNPESAEGHYDLARALAADGRLALALRSLARARALAPRDRRLAIAEADVQRGRARLDLALAAVRRYLAGGDDARVRLELGKLLQQQGRRAEAEREIAAARALDPSLEAPAPDGAARPR